jgi:sensor histidine kinase YesM
MKYQKAIFWILQITVWSLYYLYNINIVHGLAMPESREVVYFYLILYSYFAIPLTLLLRIGYKWLSNKSISNWKFASYVFIFTLIAANIWSVEVYLLDRLFEDQNTQMTPVNLKFYLWELFGDFLVLLAWSAFYLLIKLWYEWQSEKEKAEKASLLAERSQLLMLRHQLNPHFLFNTLSSLRALIRENKEKAEDMLSKISDFLRYSLARKKDIEVPFSEELAAIKNYIEIEKVRYGENLNISYEIDPLSEDYPVLCFLMHPIIENAVKFGMDTSIMPLQVVVKSEVINNKIVLQILNTGRWVNSTSNADQKGTGNGLLIVQQRLKHFYPDNHKFTVCKEEGWVSVIIEITNTSYR